MSIGRFAAALALAVLTTVPVAQAQDAYTITYGIDPVHSSIGFKVKHMMVSDVRGWFDTFSGAVNLDPKNIENSSVEVTIDAASIATRNEKRDGHLKSADFFDVEKFPTITFKSKKIVKKGEQWIAVGDFTLHGVTKEIEIPFTMSGPVSAGNASILGVSAAIEINRQDFGVSWDKKLDTGGAVVSDQVHIEIDVEAKKQTS